MVTGKVCGVLPDPTLHSVGLLSSRKRAAQRESGGGEGGAWARLHMSQGQDREPWAASQRPGLSLPPPALDSGLSHCSIP